jgi:hypothetical protein
MSDQEWDVTGRFIDVLGMEEFNSHLRDALDSLSQTRLKTFRVFSEAGRVDPLRRGGVK